MEAPKPRKAHLWSAVLYMQFIKEFSPDLHYVLEGDNVQEVFGPRGEGVV